jgi:hypothetical protein
MKDDVHTAQVDDTRAKVLLAEGRTAEAERLVRSAVQILERGGEQSPTSRSPDYSRNSARAHGESQSRATNAATHYRGRKKRRRFRDRGAGRAHRR